MQTSQILRASRAVQRSATRSALAQSTRQRTFATSAGFPPQQPTPPNKKDGTGKMLMYSTLIIGAGAVGWFLMQSPTEQAKLKAKAQKEEAELKKQFESAVDTTKARGSTAYRESERKVEQLTADAKAKLDSARKETDAKYADYKGTADKKAGELRQSTEDLYRDAKGSVLKEKEQQKKSSGWFSWLGW